MTAFEDPTPETAGVDVTFDLPAAVGATTVVIVGDFNDWSADAHPMTRHPDGSFTATLVLLPGRRYHYRYLVDGHRWENDWTADDYEPNIYGGDDSVIDLIGRTRDNTPGQPEAPSTTATPPAPTSFAEKVRKTLRKPKD